MKMGWRYKAGLALIGTVVVIWVTSAEVTQVVSLSSGSKFQDFQFYFISWSFLLNVLNYFLRVQSITSLYTYIKLLGAF